MSDVPPPPPDPPEAPSARPDTSGSRRRRLEGVIPELLKRAIEIGVDKAQDAPESLKHFVGDLKLPKEIVTVILQQVDETKNGLFRVVAKEIRDFLEHTNISSEMQKMLTTVQFEVNTTIRFTPNDGRSNKKKKSKGERGAKAVADEAPDSSEELPEDTGDEEDTPDSERVPLPKPEVKTAVHVARGSADDDRKRRRDRG